jgi:hypothetical protein
MGIGINLGSVLKKISSSAGELQPAKLDFKGNEERLDLGVWYSY